MGNWKKYYVAWSKRDNHPISVFDMAGSAARYKCWAWLDRRNWDKDKIVNNDNGKEYTWVEACATTKETLRDFVLNTWLGHTNFTDPDMCLYEVNVKEDE